MRTTPGARGHGAASLGVAVSARLVSDSVLPPARCQTAARNLNALWGMYCRGCKALTADTPLHGDFEQLGHFWGADRISGLRCGRCGVLLGTEDVARLLEEKALQLARFGLLTGSSASHGADPAARPRSRTLRLWKD